MSFHSHGSIYMSKQKKRREEEANKGNNISNLLYANQNSLTLPGLAGTSTFSTGFGGLRKFLKCFN